MSAKLNPNAREFNPAAAPFSPDNFHALNASAVPFVPIVAPVLSNIQEPLNPDVVGTSTSVPLLGGFRLRRESEPAGGSALATVVESLPSSTTASPTVTTSPQLPHCRVMPNSNLSSPPTITSTAMPSPKSVVMRLNTTRQNPTMHAHAPPQVSVPSSSFQSSPHLPPPRSAVLAAAAAAAAASDGLSSGLSPSPTKFGGAGGRSLSASSPPSVSSLVWSPPHHSQAPLRSSEGSSAQRNETPQRKSHIEPSHVYGATAQHDTLSGSAPLPPHTQQGSSMQTSNLPVYADAARSPDASMMPVAFDGHQINSAPSVGTKNFKQSGPVSSLCCAPSSISSSHPTRLSNRDFPWPPHVLHNAPAMTGIESSPPLSSECARLKQCIEHGMFQAQPQQPFGFVQPQKQQSKRPITPVTEVKVRVMTPPPTQLPPRSPPPPVFPSMPIDNATSQNIVTHHATTSATANSTSSFASLGTSSLPSNGGPAFANVPVYAPRFWKGLHTTVNGNLSGPPQSSVPGTGEQPALPSNQTPLRNVHVDTRAAHTTGSGSTLEQTPSPASTPAGACSDVARPVQETAQPHVMIPSYIPKFWQQQQHSLPPKRQCSTRLNSPPLFSPENPIVVLIYGCRGSGKSTQAELVAKKFNLLALSSGDMFRSGKKPFIELRRTVREQFGPTGAKLYNGLVLDRFIVNSEVDAYYVQSALNEAHLPLPLVFWLQLNPYVGMKRAEDRGDTKSAFEYWRFVEQRAQISAVNVYQPCGCLVTIDVDKQKEEAISSRIFAAVEAHIRDPNRCSGCLPLYSPIPNDRNFVLIDEYESYMQIAKEVHASIGNIEGRIDSAPLSSIGGYVDRNFFLEVNKSKRSPANSMHVTLKVDGQRFLVVKHRVRGFLGFSFIFTCCFDFNHLFAGVAFPPSKHSDGESNPIEALLDTELGVRPSGAPVLHIIDFVYLHGNAGRWLSFVERYRKLLEWLPESHHFYDSSQNTQHFCLKKYVPINELGRLLPQFECAPFAIDGIVFQHNGVYRFGVNKLLLKWKPQELCTADFRLMKGAPSGDGRFWEFQLYVTDSTVDGSTFQEIRFAGAVGVFTAEEVYHFKLRDSLIVELRLHSIEETEATSVDNQEQSHPLRRTRWSFHRLRQDKVAPNKLWIVMQIASLLHLSYKELVELCSKVRYSPMTRKLFPIK